MGTKGLTMCRVHLVGLGHTAVSRCGGEPSWGLARGALGAAGGTARAAWGPLGLLHPMSRSLRAVLARSAVRPGVGAGGSGVGAGAHGSVPGPGGHAVADGTAATRR